MASDGHDHEPGLPRDHAPGHGHHHHDGPADFDWEAMADSLALDGAMVLPLVHDVVRDLAGTVDWRGARHVMDIGCGPGVIACALAHHAPAAKITALDTSEPLLARTNQRATAESLADRVHTITADLDAPLPPLAPADVIWASMVLHHVADPPAVLATLRDQLRPGGVLTMIEFAGPSAVLPQDDPLLSSGAWSRFEALNATVRRERLGLDPITLAWPRWLADAGYADVTDRTRVAYHDAPLSSSGRRWIAQHVNRGLQMAGDRLPAGDISGFQDLVDGAAARPDLFVRLERRVITARRV